MQFAGLDTPPFELSLRLLFCKWMRPADRSLNPDGLLVRPEVGYLP